MALSSGTGKIDGEDNTIFFANDGRLTMLVDAEQTQGRWELRGTKVCILVEDEDDDCYDIEVSGNVATLKEDATTSYRLDIAKGNVKIHCCTEKGALIRSFTLEELLPASFGPENLA